MGDILFALPAVQALAGSGIAERVSWLVEDRAAALLAGQDFLERVVIFPRRSPTRWPAHAIAMRRRRDDVVLDLQGSLKSRLQLACLRAQRKLGFNSSLARDGAEAALTQAIQPPVGARHRVAQNMALVAALGVPVPAAIPRPRLPDDPAARGRARRRLQEQPGRGPVVVLHPGTSAFGRLKRWSADRFAEVAANLTREVDARVVVTAGPGEAALADEVARLARVPVLRPPGGGIWDLAALLAEAHLVIAADSFPLHLANALGTPVLGLYGPKDPTVTGPAYDRSRVVRAGVACSPCTLRRCDDRICMERLEAARVTSAALALLEDAAA